jgi:hypothetical protein
MGPGIPPNIGFSAIYFIPCKPNNNYLQGCKEKSAWVNSNVDDSSKNYRPGVNFTNIRADFLYKRSACSFLYLHLRFVPFWHNNIDAKVALKMLVKLTPGCKEVV